MSSFPKGHGPLLGFRLPLPDYTIWGWGGGDPCPFKECTMWGKWGDFCFGVHTSALRKPTPDLRSIPIPLDLSDPFSPLKWIDRAFSALSKSNSKLMRFDFVVVHASTIVAWICVLVVLRHIIQCVTHDDVLDVVGGIKYCV